MKKHLKYGGSTAERTLACPAWADRAEGSPAPASSIYADEGSLLHDAMEAHYSEGTPFEDLAGSLTFAGITLTQDHVARLLQPAWQMTESVLDEYDIDYFMCEPFVQLIPGVAGGSIDMLGLSVDGKTVLLLDYKYGSKRVAAEENSQLQFYALCASVDPLTRPFFEKAERLVHAIVQPKCSKDATTWEQSLEGLEPFHRRILSAMYDEPKPASPGSHCYFCPVAACPERRQKAWESTIEDLDAPRDVKEALARERVPKNLLKFVDTISSSA